MAHTLRAALVGASLVAGIAAAHAAVADPVVLTFATIGDSRQDQFTQDVSQKPLSAQDAHWLQNSKAWSRVMREVVSKKSNLLFFNGDMIMGYGNSALPAALPATVDAYMNVDLGRTYTQYAFWRGMVATAMEAGTYVVPVPGNHETQCSTKVNAACPTTNGGKNALAVNENAWRANMGDLVMDSLRFPTIVGQPYSNFSVSNNPCPAGVGCTDGTSTDQSQLSYSFDVADTHFAVINTDAVGRDSHAPTAWLTTDFANAQARGAKHFFVFGHKPAYTYYYAGSDTTKASGLDADVPARDAFWTLIESYGATYFCGHEHLFNVQQPKGGAYQLLVGSGGSPFDASNPAQVGLVPTDRMYAYAYVRIHQSGKVDVDAYGFSDAFGPTMHVWGTTLAH
jgi:hypothetical protein